MLFLLECLEDLRIQSKTRGAEFEEDGDDRHLSAYVSIGERHDIWNRKTTIQKGNS